MKSELDKSLESKLREKLSGLGPALPPDGFAAIQRRLAARRRKRRLARLAALLAFLLLAGGLYWAYAPFLSEPAAAGVQAGDQRVPIAPLPMDLPKTSVKPGSRTGLEAGFESEKTQHRIKASGAEEAPPIEGKDFLSGINRPAPVNRQRATVQREELFSPAKTGEEKTDGQRAGHFKAPDTLLASTTNMLHEISPGITRPLPERPLSLPSFILPEAGGAAGPAWEFGLLTGLHFYHAIPNRKDGQYFYALESPGQDWSFSTMASLHWELSPRFSLGVQGQYHYMHSKTLLESIEEKAGSIALVKPRGEQEALFFRDYRQRVENVGGSFHQLGLGAVLRHGLFQAGNRMLDAQLQGTYLKLLNPGGNALFSEEELSLGFSLGLRQPVNERLEVALRPGFSYRFALRPVSDALQLNRMIFGLELSLSRRPDGK